jgi:ATP-binding protein involved in chromosome partitioning
LKLRTYHDLSEPDRSALGEQVASQQARVRDRLAGVRHVVAVVSGKGGVGKSLVTAGLALELAGGRSVGVLDADLAGPTAARMLGAPREAIAVTDSGAAPAKTAAGVRVMSSDLLLEEGAPLAFKGPDSHRHVWRGTLEAGMLREFLADVAWGELDLLLVDLPPGTDRLATLYEYVPGLSGTLAVTIPSDASLRAVKRSLALAQESGIRVLGIVENMSGYSCERCGHTGALFEGRAGSELAAATGAPLLGRIPFQPDLQAAADAGRLPIHPARSALFAPLASALIARLEP